MREKMRLRMISLLMVVFLVIGLTGCAGTKPPVSSGGTQGTENGSENDSEIGKVYEGGVSRDLMDSVSAGNVEGNAIDELFIKTQLDLDLKLFQQSVAATPEKNTLISPLSIQLALAMTANGADGNTKIQMENLLTGSLGMEALNKYLYTYVNNLPSAEKYKVNIANSIWFRDDTNRFQVEPDFLQTNANYYNAQLNASPFDDNTVVDINNWVDKNTDGMIKEILQSIPGGAVMYLINAIAFDAEWADVYNKDSVRDGKFTCFDGSTKTVSMMYSEEWGYLEDEDATGFVKAYKENKYSFVALLPKKSGEEAFYDYIEGLSVEKLQNLLENVESTKINTSLPKFSYEYSLGMNDVLKTMGMEDAFSPDMADFTKMAHSSSGNIYISSVLHKTFIQVDELGTKAGAVTMVEMSDECAPSHSVYLNRPFVYMIMDNETNLPIFIGTVINFEQ